MKKYQFEQTNLFGKDYVREITLEDDVIFCESARYNDKQRFFFSVIKDITTETKKLLIDNNLTYYQLGNLTIITINNVMPLCDIPIIDINDINAKYVPDLRNMIIVSEIENKEYKWLLRELNIAIEENGFESDKVDSIDKKLKDTEQKYIEAICRPLEFVYGGDKSPMLLCDVVQFRSWLKPDLYINTFQKTSLPINKIEKTVYVGEEAGPWKKIFVDRIIEITKTAFE